MSLLLEAEDTDVRIIDIDREKDSNPELKPWQSRPEESGKSQSQSQSHREEEIEEEFVFSFPFSSQNSSESASEKGSPRVCCSICRSVPTEKKKLYGCIQYHYICDSCREAGGVLLSCPRCKSSDISLRLRGVEDAVFGPCYIGLETERPDAEMICTYDGCTSILPVLHILQHQKVCEYRPVLCPKTYVSQTCKYVGPLKSIQLHGREEHELHKGVLYLEPGLVSCKLIDKDDSFTRSPISFRFSPLELAHAGRLFYICFERSATRSLWTIYVRMYDTDEEAEQYSCDIRLASSRVSRFDIGEAKIAYIGINIAPYSISRADILKDGRMFATVDDEKLRSFKFDTVLFRLWVKVYKRDN